MNPENIKQFIDKIPTADQIISISVEPNIAGGIIVAIIVINVILSLIIIEKIFINGLFS